MFFWASCLVLVACAIVLLALAVSGQPLADLRRASPALLVMALLFGGLALWGWYRDRRSLAAAAEAEQAVRQRLQTEVDQARAETARTRREAEERRELERREADEELKGARDEIDREREEGKARLASERRSREVVERARRAEREWAEEMRSQVIRLHRERGALSNPDDVPGLVLQTAISLLDAEKGLLLSRRESGARLSVVRHLGFDHDPQDSALARSFAERVMCQDETIRDPHPALEPIAGGVLHHHERFDGTGYPARLRGEQIPIEARIICV